MKLLVDTHAFLWWVEQPAKLSQRAYATLNNQENTALFSAASAWEMAIKVQLGKLDAMAIVTNLERHLEEQRFVAQPITLDHAVGAGLLPLHHRDPFDRLLIAQAQSLDIPILSADPILDRYDVNRLW